MLSSSAAKVPPALDTDVAGWRKLPTMLRLYGLAVLIFDAGWLLTRISRSADSTPFDIRTLFIAIAVFGIVITLQVVLFWQMIKERSNVLRLILVVVSLPFGIVLLNSKVEQYILGDTKR